MAERPRITFPRRAPGALRSLVERLAIAVGIVVFIGLLTWLGRDGYSDADGTPVSLLDAFYYATVTATTTGYGDIAPVDPAARAITAFVVTPLRILFLIVLVGTTLELLTERFRRARAESLWRSRVKQHTIVVGYGTMGRGAAETLLANGAKPSDVVVVDHLPDAVAAAGAAGLVGVVADGTRTSTWRQLRLDAARAVVVTCNRDDTAVLVTLTARELNATVPIAVAVREAENAHLLSQSGATTVVLSSEAAGRLVGLSTQAPARRRRARGPPQRRHRDGSHRAARSTPTRSAARRTHARSVGLPIALIRGTARVSFDDPAFQRVEPGDIVVSLSGRGAERDSGSRRLGRWRDGAVPGHRAVRQRHARCRRRPHRPLARRRQPGRQAGGHPPRRPGAAMRRGSQMFDPARYLHRPVRPAPVRSEHPVGVGPRRRPDDEHDGRTSSPTSSGCASTSASSAGSCGAGRGGRCSVFVYAEAFTRSRVSEMVLVSVVGASRDDIAWITRSMGRVFPSQWERFRDAVPPGDRDGDLAAAYARLLQDPDPAVHGPAAAAWCEWEDTHVATVARAHARRALRRPGVPPLLRPPRDPLLGQRAASSRMARCCATRTASPASRSS